MTGIRIVKSVYRTAQRLRLALRTGGVLMISCKEALWLPEHDIFELWPDAEGFFRRKSSTEASQLVPNELKT